MKKDKGLMAALLAAPEEGVIPSIVDVAIKRKALLSTSFAIGNLLVTVFCNGEEGINIYVIHVNKTSTTISRISQ